MAGPFENLQCSQDAASWPEEQPWQWPEGWMEVPWYLGQAIPDTLLFHLPWALP